ncbi:AAEL012963-PA [Aedes aegypti]|uniref:AAEL012963-PA n=1 Tax=Aedes aegypti TaxID=7159 RepID=Q16KJ9_AEDAE|nr:AAEL012963-PA [Aedes aegypti]
MLRVIEEPGEEADDVRRLRPPDGEQIQTGPEAKRVVVQTRDAADLFILFRFHFISRETLQSPQSPSEPCQYLRPLVHKFDGLLQLVKGIDRLEVSVPIIKEQPQEIHNQVKSKVLGMVKPYTEKKKANEVLASQYRRIAVNGVDTTAQLAERLLDYYFPKCEGDDEDNALISTVGRLSNEVARRVYRIVSKQVKTLRKEDVKEYVVTLIAVLRLTQYLNFLNDKRQHQAGEDQSAPASNSTAPAHANSSFTFASNTSAVVSMTNYKIGQEGDRRRPDIAVGRRIIRLDYDVT